MRRALGKGIKAIIPEETRRELAAEARTIPLTEIRPNPFQPRRRVEDDIEDLTVSVREKGVLQPVVVRRRRDGYELVMGERRFRAAVRAGLTEIPAVVRSATDGEMLELALVENVQRRNLNPIDEALAYKRLADEFGLSQEEIAAKVGRDRSTVANALRLLGLPFKVRDAVAAGLLSAGHARALLQLSVRREQVELAERIIRDGLSVRQAEAICAGPAGTGRRRRKEKDVHVREVEERLQQRLGTKVEVADSGKGSGRVVVRYHSWEDLERMVRLITGG
ncbi:MAG TPA: ParB/RepB/Spo0J family partition protein [candidate division WOR-3 bacterium]|uniref:ParB/RepB/Spo0J family partition protein n=1 Tax=candidate division WOR-3 bacterium TaxID=2052148 RepID=A0A7V0T4W7_UNCW3|nr:ParB/RepB/Spo0J family partition protein [candidate division WOR-3 bacterium]